MGMPENSFLKTMLIGGVIAIVASLPMFWIFDMAGVCFLLLLTGILGVLGGLNAVSQPTHRLATAVDRYGPATPAARSRCAAAPVVLDPV